MWHIIMSPTFFLKHARISIPEFTQMFKCRSRYFQTSRKCGHFVRSFSKLSKVRISVAKFPQIRKCAIFGFEEISVVFENVHILVVTFLKIQKCTNFGRNIFKKFETFAIFANENYKFRKRWNFQDHD